MMDSSFNSMYWTLSTSCFTIHVSWKSTGINWSLGKQFRWSWLEGGVRRMRLQTGCPWSSAASWDSSLPFQISMFSRVSVLIIDGTLAEVNAACAFVSSFTSGCAGCPENICWDSSVCAVIPAGRLGLVLPSLLWHTRCFIPSGKQAVSGLGV